MAIGLKTKNFQRLVLLVVVLFSCLNCDGRKQTGEAGFLGQASEQPEVCDLESSTELSEFCSEELAKIALPKVAVGSDVISGRTKTLEATVSGEEPLVLQWTQTSGPGSLTFGSADKQSTTVKADSDGEYVIRFTAEDKYGRSVFDELNLLWDSTAPTVSAGDDAFATSTHAAAGQASDATAMTYEWTMVSGPGTLSFGSAAALQTSISADTDGVYVIRLTATDGVGLWNYDEFTLEFDATAPIVNAGGDVDTSVLVNQDASVTDYSAISYLWTQQSGPGTISFGTPSTEDTTITADLFGTYVVRLQATDAHGHSAYDEITFKWEAFTKTWDFQTPSDYTYNGTKIEIASDIAQLIESPNVSADDSAADFNLGTYTDTQWNAVDSVELDAAGLTAKTGSFRSQVLDAGSAVDWQIIRWSEGGSLPYLADLPDNQGTGPGFNQAVDMTDNVFLFHMNELKGSTSVTDSSGYNHVATCSGTQCPQVGEQGRIGEGSYRYYESQQDQFEVPDHPSLNVSGDASFVAWIKIATFPGTGVVYMLEKGQDDVNDSYGFLVYKSGANYYPSFEFNDLATGTYRFFGATTTVVIGQWHHVAVVVDDTNDKILFYLDGQPANGAGAANTAQLNPNYTNSLLIGKQNYPTGGHLTFDGWLDEIAIFDRSLTSAEIYEMYLRGSIRLDLQVRGCADGTCSGDPAFVGPDGTNASKYTGAAGVGNIQGITSNRYMQYEATFSTPDSSYSPKLQEVSFTTVDTGNPEIVLNTGHTYTALSSFQQKVLISHVGTIKYQLSNDGTNWYYHDSSNWVPAAGYAQTNSATDVDANISSFVTDVGVGDLSFKAFLSAENDTGLIRLKEITITGDDGTL